jgi:NADP-dependent 3-hydroxy acid dehydrogenase YdfG
MASEEANLHGTVALVTGASSGIGEATARRLARLGAQVSFVARRRDRLDRLAAEIASQDGRALPIEADITDRANAEGAVEQTRRHYGRLDIVVNNAGVMLLGPIEGAPIEEWERMVSLNVMGALYTTNAALPHLLEAAQDPVRRVSDLVNISSVAGRVARAGVGAYNLTKFGLGAFSEALRQEVTRRHLRVALVEPGGVETELTDHLRPEIREQSLQRFKGIEKLLAEDIADAIAYIVTRPRRMAVNEMLIRPTEQEG